MISCGPILGIDRHPRISACLSEKYEMEKKELVETQHTLLEIGVSVLKRRKCMYGWLASDDGCNSIIDRGKPYVEN